MATIAVFIALGAGAYAAGLAPDSVKSKHIAPDAAKGVDVAEETLDQVPDAAHANDADTVGGKAPHELDRGGVVARAHGDSSVAAAGMTAYPLTSNTWTQQADEVDTQFAIRVRGDVPSFADCNAGGNSQAHVFVFVDGQQAGADAPISIPITQTAQNDFVLSEVRNAVNLFEPGSPTQRTLTASVSDICQGQHFVLESLTVDVVGFR